MFLSFQYSNYTESELDTSDMSDKSDYLKEQKKREAVKEHRKREAEEKKKMKEKKEELEKRKQESQRRMSGHASGAKMLNQHCSAHKNKNPGLANNQQFQKMEKILSNPVWKKHGRQA